MQHQARLDAPGTLHHILARGIEKRSIVNDVADRKNFAKRLGEMKLTDDWVFQPRPYQKL